jgi:hypothetical protein
MQNGRRAGWLAVAFLLQHRLNIFFGTAIQPSSSGEYSALLVPIKHLEFAGDY